ncbi:MAG TPA: NAD(P)H-dependent oxidoreductase [Gemmatimonadales bacterium]|nr:NAD(P)H-dependent oxidoreductase [Gemmatimonadales bacterium]
MRLLAFAASLKRESLNRKLINLAVELAREAQVEVDLADFREFDMPLYDADLQSSAGFPEGARELARRIEAVDGLMIASPEYNYSLPGTLKNAIDWVSRMKPMPLRGKHGVLLAASTSLVGGSRGLWALRVPLESLGVMLLPDMFALAQAPQAFDEHGKLKDPELQERLRKLMHGYLDMGKRLTG